MGILGNKNHNFQVESESSLSSFEQSAGQKQLLVASANGSMMTASIKYERCSICSLLKKTFYQNPSGLAQLVALGSNTQVSATIEERYWYAPSQLGSPFNGPVSWNEVQRQCVP